MFLVLPTFPFAPRTNPSLLFINSITIPNPIYVSAPHHQTSPSFIVVTPLPKHLQLCSRRPFLNILDTIPTKNIPQHFAAQFFSPTNHYLSLLQNQFLPQFYFHGLSFCHTINNLALKRLTHHIQSTMDDYLKHFQLQTKQPTILTTLNHTN